MSNQALEKPKTPAPVTVLGCLESPRWSTELSRVLPKEMVLEAVVRVARSAVSGNPNLSRCDPQSFLLALLKCARAGLYPDGREAHLIPYKDQVQAIFDWKGIVALARRAGVDVSAKLVYADDHFEVDEDDGTGRTKLVHKVDYRKPRGELMAVWSRACQPNGTCDYEVMTKDEVEEVRRKFSRAADSDAWKKSFGEMAKKTCIRRHSKRWDMSPELREAINNDDDTPPTGLPLPTSEPKLRERTVEVAATVTVSPPGGMAAVLESIRNKAADSKIGEGALLVFIKQVCPINPDAGTLEEAAVESEETLRMVNDQWDDIAKRIHAN